MVEDQERDQKLTDRTLELGFSPLVMGVLMVVGETGVSCSECGMKRREGVCGGSLVDKAVSEPSLMEAFSGKTRWCGGCIT